MQCTRNVILNKVPLTSFMYSLTTSLVQTPDKEADYFKQVKLCVALKWNNLSFFFIFFFKTVINLLLPIYTM